MLRCLECFMCSILYRVYRVNHLIPVKRTITVSLWYDYTYFKEERYLIYNYQMEFRNGAKYLLKLWYWFHFEKLYLFLRQQTARI